MAKTLDEAGVKRLIQEIKGANKNLNTAIPISTDNTPESMAQNVKNIADYVAKAKAAGIEDIDGMAVTCIIDDDYSGVGYLYPHNAGVYDILGVISLDDLSTHYVFKVSSGTYEKSPVLTVGSTNVVTSSMLAMGARKPIILTDDTTEVDEETYQKLLKGDTDVIAKFGEGIFLESQAKFNTGDTLNLIFGYSQFDESNDGAIATYTIFINTSAPHTLTLAIGACEPVSKSTLSPVLQEIDLRGTDAERKAKLDQFETDWKALTGADYLTGARFVGKFGITDEYDVERNVTGIMTYCAGDTVTEANDNCFYGICNGYSFSKQKSQIAVKVSCTDGSLTITPLFSHLEAITIKTGNTPDDKAANVAAIKAYVDNLTELGVDTTKGYMIPVKLTNGYHGFIMGTDADGEHTGVIKRNTYNYGGGWIFIDNIGTYQYLEFLTLGTYDSLTTTAKTIVPAINEINANAVHSDKLVPTLEAITIKTGDTPEDKAANKATIEAYRDNLTALGVDVTKGFMIPVKTNFGKGFILFDGTKGEGYVKSNNDCYGILIEAGYAVAVNNLMSTITNYNSLETTSKRVLPAINEVNALAKGYSTIFTPIELTTETAQNKTAIDARVAAFTAQGISLTNGCCIPVTYKGMYAGNISLINGDWYGLLVKNTNNPADNINIKLSADGTITEGNSAQ